MPRIIHSPKRLLRWASGIMVFLGAGHLVLLTLFAWDDITGWVDRGIWAAVPLAVTEEGDGPTVDSLLNEVTFWAGPGSFAVPFILLGCLTWHLAERGIAVPAGIGWGLAAYSAFSGVLLVPSPYFAGVVAGVLVVVAARKGVRAEANRERAGSVIAGH
ncbi:DUF6463 family protein [Nocardia sp. NPDC050793]|uniref:DUF6463 family protein n=1 Tax=Nocardia sp. NPDC050793 TaxID=3155159 RepID=UPI0033EFBF7A